MSLRVRLTAVAVILVGLGLLVAGVATRHELQGFLIDRLDQELISARGPVYGVLRAPPGADGNVGLICGSVPSDSWVVLISPAGRVAGVHTSRCTLSSSVPGFLTHAPSGTSSAGGYRLWVGNADPDGAIPAKLVIAAPLSDVNSTLNRLTILELVVGAIVLAVVAALALYVVRRELRPLMRIEETAGTIAAGDLTRRIDDADPRTEVGRLGQALNAMLAQIEQAFNERRASESRLRRFVADASHELKTPLTSVRGYAELFRRGAAERPEDLATAMQRIESESSRMSVLVDDLLLLAQLDQGRPLDREPVDLVPLVTELVEDSRAIHPQWPVDLVSNGPVTVEGDDARLHQAVGNLISNARFHCPPGTPITVRVRAEDGAAVVEVADRGPGIAPDDAARVFERFFRADPSRTRASGGTGLGLSIVASIAEAHGGRAEVDSTPGEGSTFRIVIPAA